MSAFATVQLKNKAGTEVGFNPSTVERNSNVNVANWATTNGVYDAKHRLSASLQLPSSRSPRAKMKLKIVIPQMSAVDPATKEDESIVNIDFSFSTRAAQLDRDNILAYAADLLTDPMVIALIERYEGVY